MEIEGKPYYALYIGIKYVVVSVKHYGYCIYACEKGK